MYSQFSRVNVHFLKLEMQKQVFYGLSKLYYGLVDDYLFEYSYHVGKTKTVSIHISFTGDER